MLKQVVGLIAVMGLAASGSAVAIPALQLGPGEGTLWEYYDGDKTWVTSDSSFTLNAYANATSADGGNGQYAWGSADETKTAYLVFAASPDVGAGDAFDISVSNDGGSLSLFASGWGTPPLEDPNSVAGHGIYDTYFEIYQFVYDGSLGTIYDTQPGMTGVGAGYTEIFDVVVNSMVEGVTGIHADLYTIDGNNQVFSFAPFSHDAEYTVGVPEPSSFLMLGGGLLLLGMMGRRIQS